MKLILWTLCILFVAPIQAASLNGFVTLVRDQYTYIDPQTNRRFTIKPTKVDTQESLKKLKNLDFFQGQGDFSGDDLLLDTIDFVGLRRLLGLWTADSSAIMDFQNYSKVVVYRSPILPSTSKSLLQYSIAPSSGTDWKIFFTDDKDVLLASLVLQDARASLKFFDLQSGEVVKTVEMSRLPVRH